MDCIRERRRIGFDSNISVFKWKSSSTNGGKPERVCYNIKLRKESCPISSLILQCKLYAYIIYYILQTHKTNISKNAYPYIYSFNYEFIQI